MASSDAGLSRQHRDSPTAAAAAAGERVVPGQSNSSTSSTGLRAVQPQPQRRPRPRIAGQGGGSTILVNSRQRGNPVLKGIKNVGWEFADIVPDYQVGVTSGVLFLSLRYHRLHPEYIHQRISTLGTMFSLRILLVQCDVNDHQPAIKELTKIALINNLTMMLAWTPEDVGRYIETYKAFEHKPPDIIKERVGDDYLSQLNSVLTSVRGVNKTDVMTLTSNVGSLKRIAQTDTDELNNLPGFGDIKVKRLREAFSQPFRVGEGRTMRQRKAQEALEAAERGEELPGMSYRSLSRAPARMSALPREEEEDTLELFHAAADDVLQPTAAASKVALTSTVRVGSSSGAVTAAKGAVGSIANDTSSSTGASNAALRAAAAFRDVDFSPSKGKGKAAFAWEDSQRGTVRAGGPEFLAASATAVTAGNQQCEISTRRQTAHAMLAHQVASRTAAGGGGTGTDTMALSDDATLWSEMQLDDGDGDEDAARELALEDFENLTEEDQLKMALAMSTGS
ncbi:hypothetical protein K437DRAFT_257481 [Tilletiaria anomala UBC 951]|uniref:ERCC1-like central domain-containing protein n=1 Tax=Tilletiaria anomala (strain ATCC 24038 / CBS 436.72 / UBC 951) TaxID=1037660 RepID=A0A066VX87_TILAU|nr:uncharacterized protein K437DRAFT_257481 [Tilletiaria anomala UBC 951]KDN43419.1 hypothetical protein K437DRAFT_257481 [Tilletiaria anomala UBC 951]